MTLLLGGIADDFTGGLELASILVRDGIRTRLLTRFATADDAAGLEAAVVCLKSRVARRGDAVKAVERAFDVLKPHRPRQVFLKYCATFDSTPRGNIGPCADRLMDLTGSAFTAFCPAFPAVSRTVFQGHLFAFDQLISRSPKRNDPLTPMREPDLVRVLQAQTNRRVGLIRHEDLRGGLAAIEARVAALKADGVAYAISDGADDDDLRSLASAVIEWPLMTGGSTICEHYAPLWRARGLAGANASPADMPAGRGHGVVLAGSCAERTFEQLEAFAAHHPVLMIDPLTAIGRVTAAAESAIAWARAHIDASPLAIAVSSRPGQVATLQEKLGRLGAARLAEDVVGQVARGLKALGARKFIIAGGETSGAVLEALGVRVLDVGPYEGPGTSRAVTTEPDPMSFYLKPGKLGAVDMFKRALRTA